MQTYPLTFVSRQASPSGKVALLTFDTSQLPDDRTFASGQFVMLRAAIDPETSVLDRDGEIVQRAYSLASTAQELRDHGQILFFVKETDEPLFSRLLVSTIQPGDQIQMMGPLGHFVDNSEMRHRVALSVGSGRGPMRGLMRDWLAESRDDRQIVHVFGERFLEHVPAWQQSLFAEWGVDERVQQYLFLSQEKNLPTGREQGRVTQVVDEIARSLGDDVCRFLCGHPSMVDDVREILYDEYAYARDQVLFEKY